MTDAIGKNQMTAAIFIPMRIASTRLPGKQHAMIGDKPLIHHVLDRALQSQYRPIFVACDDQKHYDMVKPYHADISVVMTDPQIQSGSDRVHAASTQVSTQFDLIVNLQGDMPFFDIAILDRTIAFMQQHPHFDIGTAAVYSSDPAWINPPSHVRVVCNRHAEAMYFSRSPIPHAATTALIHIGIYVYRREALARFVSLPQSGLELQERLEQLRALENGMKIGVCVVNAAPPISVDTPDDLEIARTHYQNISHKNSA